jgi:hypothetical protein
MSKAEIALVLTVLLTLLTTIVPSPMGSIMMGMALTSGFWTGLFISVEVAGVKDMGGLFWG